MIEVTLFILLILAFCIYYLFIYKTNNTNQVDIYKSNKCPNCGSVVEKDFNVCPICKETLKKHCENCGEKVEVHWNFCPYCEKHINKGKNK